MSNLNPMIPIRNQRLPLQETSSINMGNTSTATITDTPISIKNPKISTPPESVYSRKKNGSSIPETPISKNYDYNQKSDNAFKSKESALLSPAFSSPQQSQVYYNANNNSYINLSIPPKPSFEQPEETAIKKKPTKKQKKELKESGFCITSDDKPPYSYATLIGMSILTHPDKKLTLSLIYLWISDTFKYYKREDVGWQNSIRHNLSLNKAFIKGDKSKDGKGHFWCIKADCEDLFLKSRNNKKSGFQEVMDQLRKVDNNPTINSIPSSPNFNNTDDSHEEALSHKRKLSDDNDDGNYKRIKPLSESFDSSLMATPKVSNSPSFLMSESPNKPLLAGKNLTYTSSFSCNSNLELSPIRTNETGPLLEPLTPANNIYKSNQPFNLSNVHHHQPPHISLTNLSIPFPSAQQVVTSQSNPYSLSQYQISNNLSVPTSTINIKTPKSNIKTPLRTLKTPQTGSIIKKLWNSPSYLDDFYYSPLISSSHHPLNSYDDDDMIMRAYESPVIHINGSKKILVGHESSRNLFNDLKKFDKPETDLSKKHVRSHSRKFSFDDNGSK